MLSLWEPGMPSPSERIQALKLAYDAGFQTGVVAYPLLGGVDAAQALLEAVRPFVVDTVQFALLTEPISEYRKGVDLANSAQATAIPAMLTDDQVRLLVDTLSADPLVRFHDSVKEVVDAIRNPQ